MGENVGEMTSIVLSKAEHDAFTAAWRQLIPYGTNATREEIENAARQVYRDHPDILRALRLN
jgi:hypothetical protein